MSTTKSEEEMLEEAFAAYDREDFGVAKEILISLVDQGNARATNALGYLYYSGHGVEKDIKHGFELMRKSAEQGCAKAQCNLGGFYNDGEEGFIDQDYSLAAEWYTKAANQGSADAQFELGQNYYFGHGFAQDYKLAKEWFSKAAVQGDSGAQFNLAVILAKGEGCEINDHMAAVWYEKAATQGHAKAQYTIATYYQSGTGVIQDDEQAAAWMHKAAEQGHANAQFRLAQIYDSGKGVVLDADKANFWYGSAAEQGIKKPTVADLDGHLILLNHNDRQRFGYAFLMDNSNIPHMDEPTCLFREVDDGERRMPVAKVELENVLVDYGPTNGMSEKDKFYIPWINRISQCSDDNVLTSYRAALIATSDLVLSGANEELAAQLLVVQALRGSDLTAWSDEEIKIAIQLSRQEAERSLKEIAQRANLAKMIADHINAENNSDNEQSLLQ